jgi:hypothetical protein
MPVYKAKMLFLRLCQAIFPTAVDTKRTLLQMPGPRPSLVRGESVLPAHSKADLRSCPYLRNYPEKQKDALLSDLDLQSFRHLVVEDWAGLFIRSLFTRPSAPLGKTGLHPALVRDSFLMRKQSHWASRLIFAALIASLVSCQSGGGGGSSSSKSEVTDPNVSFANPGAHSETP